MKWIHYALIILLCNPIVFSSVEIDDLLSPPNPLGNGNPPDKRQEEIYRYFSKLQSWLDSPESEAYRKLLGTLRLMTGETPVVRKATTALSHHLREEQLIEKIKMANGDEETRQSAKRLILKHISLIAEVQEELIHEAITIALEIKLKYVERIVKLNQKGQPRAQFQQSIQEIKESIALLSLSSQLIKSGTESMAKDATRLLIASTNLLQDSLSLLSEEWEDTFRYFVEKVPSFLRYDLTQLAILEELEQKGTYGFLEIHTEEMPEEVSKNLEKFIKENGLEDIWFRVVPEDSPIIWLLNVHDEDIVAGAFIIPARTTGELKRCILMKKARLDREGHGHKKWGEILHEMGHHQQAPWIFHSQSRLRAEDFGIPSWFQYALLEGHAEYFRQKMLPSIRSSLNGKRENSVEVSDIYLEELYPFVQAIISIAGEEPLLKWVKKVEVSSLRISLGNLWDLALIIGRDLSLDPAREMDTMTNDQWRALRLSYVVQFLDQRYIELDTEKLHAFFQFLLQESKRACNQFSSYQLSEEKLDELIGLCLEVYLRDAHIHQWVWTWNQENAHGRTFEAMKKRIVPIIRHYASQVVVDKKTLMEIQRFEKNDRDVPNSVEAAL